MATATKPPGTIAGRLQQQQSCIDEMRASARMRARLMKKMPKPLEFPRGLVEMTTAGTSLGTSPGTSAGPGRTVAATDADALEEPSLPRPENPSGLTYSIK